ncbi:MAG: substrate-binding domain-containing protein [Geminicoccaceae bacterium]
MTEDRREPEIRPGVRSIARATGLSVATVSRVLNGSANVKTSTRDRVLAAVRDLGYAPHAAARALATSRTRTIAAVVPTLEHSIFARFLNMVEVELARHGYALIIATSGGAHDQELKRVRELLDMGGEGLILSGIDHHPELLELIEARRVPTVCTSIYDAGSPLPTIGYDNENLGKDAIGYLQDLGHRRIAVIHGPLADNDRTRLRRAGIERASRPETELHFFETNLVAAGGAAAARSLLGKTCRPSAALCLSDVLALGVLFESGRQGLDVPEQLSVMGFDDLDWAEHSQPSLTTIKLPTAEMGRMAADALVDRLDHGIELPSLCLPSSIVTRMSTARAG